MTPNTKQKIDATLAKFSVQRWKTQIFTTQLEELKKRLAIRYPTAPEEFITQKAKYLLYRVSN